MNILNGRTPVGMETMSSCFMNRSTHILAFLKPVNHSILIMACVFIKVQL